MTEVNIGPLNLDVTGYASDITGDFYQANWLSVTVACNTDDGPVAFRAPCLMTTDVFDFMDEITALLAGEAYQAFLVSLEPQVDVRLRSTNVPGTYSLDVELAPDGDDEDGMFGLSAPLTREDLDRIAMQAAQIIEAYPVRGLPAP